MTSFLPFKRQNALKLTGHLCSVTRVTNPLLYNYLLLKNWKKKEAKEEFKEFFNRSQDKQELCYCFDQAAQFNSILALDWL